MQITESNEAIQLGEIEISYKLIRSKKRKSSLVMKLAKNGILQVRVPYFTKDYEIDNFLLAKKNWISKQLQTRTFLDSDIGFSNGDYQLFKGQKYRIEYIKSSPSKVYLKDSSLFVFSNTLNFQSILEKWFKTESINYLINRTYELAQLNNFPKVREIKVRKMRSSWGNCRSNAVITYNYNLIKAPVELIDYVIIHELCHLFQPNHSSKFYQLQASMIPNWKQLKAQLDSLAPSIM